MSLMALVAAGQRGLLIRTVGGAIGVDETVARDALERLLTAVARRLNERAGDPAECQILLDVIANGGYQRYLDDARALLGRAAIGDGEQALVYLYGSVEVAREHARSIGPPAGLDAEVFARLMTLAASLLLAAMARRLEQQANDRLAEGGPAAVLTGLGQALLRGFVEGTRRALFRRRASFQRRMARRRRLARGASGRPSLDDLLGDLLHDNGG
jgi:hypothetical protein